MLLIVSVDQYLYSLCRCCSLHLYSCYTSGESTQEDRQFPNLTSIFYFINCVIVCLYKEHCVFRGGTCEKTRQCICAYVVDVVRTGINRNSFLVRRATSSVDLCELILLSRKCSEFACSFAVWIWTYCSH